MSLIFISKLNSSSNQSFATIIAFVFTGYGGLNIVHKTCKDRQTQNNMSEMKAEIAHGFYYLLVTDTLLKLGSAV